MIITSQDSMRGLGHTRLKCWVARENSILSANLQAALSALGEPSDSTAMLSALKSVRAASLNCYIFEVSSS